MTRLYLVRHGETEWNKNGKVQGRTDTELSPEGVAQAKLCLLYTSPSPRDS